ncbi:hypothetical protein L218DRAFT_941927 [Marasmius fiardii PR-910]|nr:hypothetical protein L218DRAFT_941927 [Marasmius fiardii PR-910]
MPLAVSLVAVGDVRVGSGEIVGDSNSMRVFSGANIVYLRLTSRNGTTEAIDLERREVGRDSEAILQQANIQTGSACETNVAQSFKKTVAGGPHRLSTSEGTTTSKRAYLN